MTLGADALDVITARLTHLPLHRRVLVGCGRRFCERAEAVAVKGSLARGAPDEFSDLDFTLAFDGGPAPHEAWMTEVVTSQGAPLASFAATHLGLDHLHIFFLEVDGFVVKVDVDMVDSSAFVTTPDDVVLRAPSNAVSRQYDDEDASATDWVDLHNKFTGWVWYTYGKIARGEWFEAVDSLNVMREAALLPFLLAALELPREGFRRLESRLDEPTRRGLEATYPRSLGHEDLVAALLAAADVFAAAATEVVPKGTDARLGRLDELVRIVRSAERRG